MARSGVKTKGLSLTFSLNSFILLKIYHSHPRKKRKEKKSASKALNFLNREKCDYLGLLWGLKL